MKNKNIHNCYDFDELMKLLEEYTENPYNHESCIYGKSGEQIISDGPDDICKECDCEIYTLIEPFLLWIRDRQYNR